MIYKIKNCFIFVLLLVILPTAVYSLKINIADLNIYSSSIDVHLTEQEKDTTALFHKAIQKLDFQGLLNINKVSGLFIESTIKSSLEASELCDLLQVDYLLYGFVEKTSRYYNVEIRIFNNISKEDQKTIFVKQELGNFDAVLAEMSLKFKDYIYQILGLTEVQKQRERGFGGISIHSGVGYWIPMTEDWWNVVTGLFNAELGVSILPVSYLAQTKNFKFNLRLNVNLSYSLGINKPDLLRSYLNTLFVKFPINFSFELFFNHVIIVGGGPGLVIDILYQKLLYDEPVSYSSLALGLFCSLKYEYWFGEKKRFAFGVNNTFNFSLYQNLLVGYQLQLYNMIRIPYPIEKKKGDK
ncbi:MAG: hypothetical protein MJB14_24090 [Spirochaetes bacterium]|nr:hypothetical protein [Spirochaetota bacterium]